MSDEETHARAAAIAFLLDRQAADGAWRDFELEPGASDSWITAFVALVLTRTHRTSPAGTSTRIETAVARAVAFLRVEARVAADGLPHWGYNRRVPTDADSTAHVALLLHAIGHPEAAQAARSLLAYAQPDGGIATFRRARAHDGWGHSHVDVSAVAARALHHARVAPEVVTRALHFLQHSTNATGVWSSYWWTSDLFATAAVLRAFRDTRHPMPNPPHAGASHSNGQGAAAFDDALQLAIATLTRRDADRSRLRHRLLTTQRGDGSWESAARLRVTDPFAPPDVTTPRTQVAADAERIYTTAHVLHALSASHHADTSMPSSGDA